MVSQGKRLRGVEQQVGWLEDKQVGQDKKLGRVETSGWLEGKRSGEVGQGVKKKKRIG